MGIAAALSGCSTASYLGQAAWGELRILLSRRPIAEALGDPAWSAERREKLSWIVRAAEDAHAFLGLERSRQFREVAALPKDFRVWVLTLAEPDRLAVRTWRFPIAGVVPYLGFFDRGRAEAFAVREHPAADRYLRTAAAFSTLGWLPEPVLPGMLALTEVSIVNTVVHELVHATIYRPGESAWNESVASALGDAGALLLFERWGRVDLAERAASQLQDRAQWQAIIARHAATFRAAYAGLAAAEDRLTAKPALLAALQDDIRKAPWRNPAWAGWADEATNHAFLLAHETYGADPSAQAEWFTAARSDFAVAVETLQRRAETGRDLWAPISR